MTRAHQVLLRNGDAAGSPLAAQTHPGSGFGARVARIAIRLDTAKPKQKHVPVPSSRGEARKGPLAYLLPTMPRIDWLRIRPGALAVGSRTSACW